MTIHRLTLPANTPGIGPAMRALSDPKSSPQVKAAANALIMATRLPTDEEMTAMDMPRKADRFPKLPTFDHIATASDDESWAWINAACDRARPVMDWITAGIVVVCFAGTVLVVLWKMAGL